MPRSPSWRCCCYAKAQTTSERRKLLCPVLACSPFGVVLVQRTAAPISEEEAQALRSTRGFPDWDYTPGEDGDPFEPKASDWGRINGELVAVDYSTPAHD
jgi:hypothetical protein